MPPLRPTLSPTPVLQQQPRLGWKARIASYCVTTACVVRRHAYFLGPGIIASVAYADPGNWATDLQAGSEFGYSLLFIVLLTGIFAVFIQILSCRVGVVTNTDIARQCRMLILKEDRHGIPTQNSISHPKWRRWALLYPLYVICEGAIVATELAELTGSAIALNLLFPALPLWAGILITSVDVVLVLFLYRPPPNGNFRLLEAVIAVLIFIVLACFIVLLVRIKPRWPDVFHGYLPSHHVVQNGALYVSVGILGATVMPHAIILGSHFASIDRLPNFDAPPRPPSTHAIVNHDVQPTGRRESISSSFSRLTRPKPETKTEVLRLSRIVRSLIHQRARTEHGANGESLQQSSLQGRINSTPDNLPPRTLENIRIHIKHASFDIGMSLISFAIVINSAILIVAAAAFYYTPDSVPGAGTVIVASLYDAFYLLKDRLGSLAAILFAVALLAAGQSASITVTLAGQLVSEGFINWKTDPFLRRIVTRLVAIVPSLAVSLAVGKNGLDEMLVASQVALSIALPFVLLPLILVTGSKARMTAEELDTSSTALPSSEAGSEASSVRSSVRERQSADPIDLARTNEIAEAEESKTRPGLDRGLGTSTFLAAIETLPREHEPPPAELQQDKKPAKASTAAQEPVTLSIATGTAVAPLQPTEQAETQTLRTKSQCFASAWYVQVVAYAIFTVVSNALA